jgi:Family of unknown function (DUF6463)
MTIASHRGLPDDGRLLQVLAVIHTVVGSFIYRPELRDIAARRFVGAAGYRGGRASAFWFLVPSPLLWIIGDLLHRAERDGDIAARRRSNSIGLGAAVAATMALPRSGFWGWIVISVRGLIRARQAELQSSASGDR